VTDQATSELSLSDSWRQWVIDNALDGVTAGDLVIRLTEAGVPKQVAASEVNQLLASPAFAACVVYHRRARQLEQIVDLDRAMAAEAPEADRVDRTERIDDADRFLRHYFAANRPLVVTEAAADWPALHRWTLEGLRKRFGEVEVEVEVERETSWKHEGRYVPMSLGVYLKQLQAAPDNARYCIARNNNIRRPELLPLLDDIRVDDRLFDPATKRITHGSSLWIGGRTLTPLHHDTTNILFHQIRGRKRWTLIPPTAFELLDGMENYYFRPGLAGVPEEVVRYEVVLEPGQALFVPVGWYHQVEALDVSISFSLMNFRRRNDFSDFGPGKL